MGLSKKLKAQSRLLLPIIIIMIVIVGVGIAFVALSVPPQRAAVDDVFVDDVYAEDSDAGGEIDITTVLRDERGEIIRQTDANILDMPFAIIDPDTSTEVGSYGIELDYRCWGINIDWSTFKLIGSWKMTEYIGVDDVGNQVRDEGTADTALETREILNPPYVEGSGGSEETMGSMIFQSISIDDLMPDMLYPPMGGGESFLQRTSWSHEVVFVFDADFALTVDDDWGNTYDSSYNIHIGLCLVWQASEFGVEWNPEVTTTTTTTGTETTATLPPDKTTVPPYPIEDVPPQDDFGDPIENPISDERISITNLGTGDIIAASLTGATGSLIFVVVVLGILLPVIAYWKIKK